ncbi:MAG: FKBP-type peptidyl-prolyl cis-trans isomerase [Lachnospiraceae bacterium]|nr:FKBP-type peptidyl-prolyl cis-trans isomerase [Lachnospiraceae bacterium]
MKTPYLCTFFLAAFLLFTGCGAEGNTNSDTSSNVEDSAAAAESQSTYSIPLITADEKTIAEYETPPNKEDPVPVSPENYNELGADAFVVLAQYKGLPQIYPEEAVITKGVIVNIDFSGVIQGEAEPREGMAGKGYELKVGSDSFLPGFDDNLLGKMKNQTAVFDLAYPPDYGVPELAGLTATWTIVINLLKTNSDEVFDTVVTSSHVTSYPNDLYNAIETMSVFDTDYLRKSYCRRWLISKAILDKENISAENPSYQAIEQSILVSMGNYETEEAAVADGYSADLIHYYVEHYLACQVINDNFIK